MGKTKIEWADVTVNPFKVAEQGASYETVGGVLVGKGRGFHCMKVSPGCERCYAEAMNLNSFYGWANLLPYDDRVLPLVFNHECMERLERKRSPCLVFVQSMSDPFHDDVPADYIDLLLMYIEGTPKHFFLLLTKRPENIEAKLPPRLRIPGAKFPDNLGIGVSVENADYMWRIEELLKFPLPLCLVSFEPLLGLIELGKWLGGYSDETKGYRERSVQSGRDGRTHNRQRRPDLACSSKAGRPMERGNQVDSLQTAPCGEFNGYLPSSPCNVQWPPDTRVGTPNGLAAFQRSDSQRLYYKPQERNKNGQPAIEFGVGDLCRTNRPRDINSGKRSASELASISWVIVGAESISGRPGRTCEPRWIADIMGRCADAGVPLFVKQAVDYTTGKLVKMPRLAPDGHVSPPNEPSRIYREYPAVLKEHFDRWTTGR